DPGRLDLPRGPPHRRRPRRRNRAPFPTHLATGERLQPRRPVAVSAQPAERPLPVSTRGGTGPAPAGRRQRRNLGDHAGGRTATRAAAARARTAAAAFLVA